MPQAHRSIARRAKWPGGCTALALLSPALPSLAAPAPDIVDLPALFVTATRQPEPALRLPFATDTVMRVPLRNEQMTASVPEALLRTPGVMVQQTSRGQGSPYLRGFTGFRTLLLVDGIRLNNSTFREGPNQYSATIDALALERIEVVKGPGSVMYGSDAVGGTINSIFRGPQYGSGPGTFWSGAAYYRHGSAEDAHLGRGEAGVSGADRWGLTFGYSGKDFGDVRGGDEVGTQPYTGYDQWDVNGSAESKLGRATRFKVAYQRTEQNDVKRTHRTIYGIDWEGLTRGTDLQHTFDQERQLIYGRLTSESPRGDLLTATVSWQDQNEYQLVERANRTRQENDTEVGTLGISLNGVSPSEWGTWTYGAEYYRDFVDSAMRNYSAAGQLTSTAIQGPVADDSEYDLLGLYAQNEIPLPERFRFILGGRFNYAHADAGRYRDPLTGGPASYSADWTHLVGSGRLLWSPDEAERWALFAGASQAFRAPNLSDLTRLDVARSGELEVAATDLDPEKFLSLEAGMKHAGERWAGSVSYFYTFIEDLIVRTPTGRTIGGLVEVTKRNASSGYVQGLEAEGSVKLIEGFSLFGALTWQYGDADAYPTSAPVEVRGPLSRVAPLDGLAGLRWDSPSASLPFFAEVFGQMADAQDRLSVDDRRDTQRIPPGGTPGWATLNFRAGCDWRERVRLHAALENALDEDYRIHGSGYNQPGRNFKLSLEYRF